MHVNMIVKFNGKKWMEYGKIKRKEGTITNI